MAPPPVVAAPTPPTVPTPPTPPSAPTVLAVSARPRGHTKWLTLAAGVILLAAASAYYAFAPTLTPMAATAPTPPPVEKQAVAAATPVETKPEQPKPPATEAEEAALKLTVADRQRIQVALTAAGFDTRGTDGAFGPRSREMIAAWQRVHRYAATGYLTAAQNQALLREGQAPPAKERRSEQETEIAVPTETAIAVAPPATAPPPASPVIIGLYGGSLSGSATGGGPASLAPVEADLRLAGRQLSGRLVHPVCGSLPVALTVDPAGSVSGNLRLYESGGCATNAASASGRLAGGTLTLDLRSAEASFRGTLSSRAERGPAGAAAPSGLRTDVP
jgi:peptidoglycan hydrolase-like protein with peptidoglycan-binding domain